MNRRTDPVIREEFTRWFRDLLWRHDLTRDAAAREVGCQTKLVERWAAGSQRALPSYESLVAIVRTFHELPPALEEAFLGGSDGTAGPEARGEGTSDTGDGPGPRPKGAR